MDVDGKKISDDHDIEEIDAELANIFEADIGGT